MIASRSKSAVLEPPAVVREQPPLCVDLDGTLVKTDLLLESLAALVRQKPWLLLMVPFWCLRGRAVLKRNLARHASIDVSSLPFNFRFLEWSRGQRAQGRRLFLVTAADRSLAIRVAEHVGIFDRVIASDGETNLKGAQKLQAIREAVPGEFEYAGNSRSDLAIWRHSSHAIAVGASATLMKRVRRDVQHVTAFDNKSPRLKDYLEALRIHQWAKNVLIFVPLITSHEFLHPRLILESCLSFVLFSLCSSAQYILNDLVDLEADRRHAVKRTRAFASGNLPLAAGFILSPVLLLSSIITAVFLSKVFALALVSYFILSVGYSLYLKEVVILDAFILAGLYTLRIIVGHFLANVQFSVWLLSFAFFLFLSLAFSKRSAELSNLQNSIGEVARRGYRMLDAGLVTLFGVCSAFMAEVVFILYLQSDRVRELYREPQLLWLLAPVFLYWICRLWTIAFRGQLSEDPVLFVLKDKATYAVAGVSGLMMTVAALGWPF
jgi:4-hydroxybenzoate polyprenyltransferase